METEVMELGVDSFGNREITDKMSVEERQESFVRNVCEAFFDFIITNEYDQYDVENELDGDFFFINKDSLKFKFGFDEFDCNTAGCLKYDLEEICLFNSEGCVRGINLGWLNKLTVKLLKEPFQIEIERYKSIAKECKEIAKEAHRTTERVENVEDWEGRYSEYQSSQSRPIASLQEIRHEEFAKASKSRDEAWELVKKYLSVEYSFLRKKGYKYKFFGWSAYKQIAVEYIHPRAGNRVIVNLCAKVYKDCYATYVSLYDQNGEVMNQTLYKTCDTKDARIKRLDELFEVFRR